MKAKYRFIGRRWNPMKQRWFYCWHTSASPVYNTYECTPVDGFWTRTSWEGT